MSLENQHVIVTGGGSGIGKAIAIYAAKKGAKISILARNKIRLEAVVSEIESLGGEAQAISCDVQKKENVFQAFKKAVETFGAIRAVIANAGIGGANQDGDDDLFDQIIQTNLSGAYYSLRAGQRNLIDDEKSRQLIVISSCLSRFGVPGYTAYCASKAGLLGLVRALALEVSQQNIQVNAICPGWVNTKMARDGIEEMAKAMGRSYEDAYHAAMRAVPSGRMSEPEEVASLVGWLLAEGSSMTGQGLDINGGSWMG
jgi:NAD(P)-dependent dehydrogenase (short-subunit alcohol dehydrogenase family)